jgi:hypothetical protein
MKIIDLSPRVTARIAGWFYVIVFVLGIYSIFSRSPFAFTAAMIAGVIYIAVSVLFYFIFKPGNPKLSLLAVIVSLAGIVIGPLSIAFKPAARISPLVFFGIYCSLIAVLIFKSTFLPRFLGVLMFFASAGWLTFISPAFATSLAPYIFLPGIIGEGALTTWLVLFGVDDKRWKEQSNFLH